MHNLVVLQVVQQRIRYGVGVADHENGIAGNGLGGILFEIAEENFQVQSVIGLFCLQQLAAAAPSGKNEH